MKLDTKQTVLSVTIVISTLYLLCALFIFFAPTTALSFFSLWFHSLDITKIAKTPELSEIAIGFVTMLIVSASFAMLFVKIWNKCEGGKK